jgi:putative DNA primase/helicase
MAKIIKSAVTRRISPKQIGEYELPSEKNGRATIAGDLTQTATGRLLTAMYGPFIRYCHATSVWFIWDEARWLADTAGVMPRAAKRVVERLLDIAAKQKDQDRKTAIQKWARKCQSAAQQEAILKQARSERGVAIQLDEFDRNPWLLGLLNGALDLRTGRFRQPRPEDYISKVCDVRYEADATCPNWCRLLEMVLPSREVRGYLQKVFGSALSGDTSDQKLHIFWGTGANGKSTIVQTYADMLGDYAIATPTSTLLRHERSNGIPNDLARLRGARFVYASEPDVSKSLADALIKLLTGGDEISARFLYGEFFSFAPEFKLVLLANHKPRIPGEDEAVWRRLRLIPFEVTIPAEQRDPHFREQKLVLERSGILNWCLEGLRLWQEEGLLEPAEVREATAEYRRDCDEVGRFLDACVEPSRGGFVMKSEMYDHFVRFHDGAASRSKAEFGHQLKHRGFRDANTGDARIWVDVTLRSF